MSIAGYIINPSFSAPNLLVTPLPAPLAAAFTLGAPRTLSVWVRPTGDMSSFQPLSYLTASPFQVGIGYGPTGAPRVRVVVRDGGGAPRQWDQAVPAELFDPAEYRHLLVSYSTAAVRVWVDGVEVVLSASGAGTNVIAAETAGHTSVAPTGPLPVWWDELAVVSGALTTPGTFRAGPSLARNLAALPGLLYWLRLEASQDFSDSGPNAVAFAVTGRTLPNNDLIYEPGVPLEAAALGPVDAPFRLALFDLRG